MRLESHSNFPGVSSIAFFFSLDSFPSVHYKGGTQESYHVAMEGPE